MPDKIDLLLLDRVENKREQELKYMHGRIPEHMPGRAVNMRMSVCHTKCHTWCQVKHWNLCQIDRQNKYILQKNVKTHVERHAR